MNKLVSGAARALALFVVLGLAGCGTRYLTPSNLTNLGKLSNSDPGSRDVLGEGGGELSREHRGGPDSGSSNIPTTRGDMDEAPTP